MPNRILCITGSPNKNGNTNRLVKHMVEAAKEEGSQVCVFDATDIEFIYPGCSACMGCQKSEEYRCVIDDDLSEKVAMVPDFDVILLASPLYWMSFTAQLKIFIDRMFSLGKHYEDKMETKISGKTFALLATAGGELHDNLSILDLQWRQSAKFMGSRYKSLLIDHAPLDPEEIEKNDELIQKARMFGKELAACG